MIDSKCSNCGEVVRLWCLMDLKLIGLRNLKPYGVEDAEGPIFRAVYASLQLEGRCVIATFVVMVVMLHTGKNGSTPR